MARRDASKALGGMAGKAATALRGRGAALDAAIGGATGSAPAKKASLKNAMKNKPAKKKSSY